MKCNRTACQAQHEGFWNPSTRAYYCRACANAINEGMGYPQLVIHPNNMPPVGPDGDVLPAGMVQIKTLIGQLQEIHDRFGNTCVYIKPGVSWGAVALNRQAADEKAEKVAS